MADAVQQLDRDHPIVKRLADNGIQSAAIIDDAYDDPTPENIPNAARAAFLAAMDESEPAQHELADLNLDLQSPTDLTNTVLETLWVERSNRPNLRRVVDATLFNAKVSKLRDVEELEKQLRFLRVEPLRFKSTDELPGVGVPLVFLDYVLGPDAPVTGLPPDPRQHAGAAVAIETDPSVEIARTKARALGQRHEKPFVVLMSNKARVDDEMAKRFRADSGYLSGLFAFVKKSELSDRNKLFLRLASWSLTLPVRHDIQRFADAIESAARAASDRLILAVRGIGLEDYATIQALGLQPDGHPLGDYMLWLYQSLISYYILDHEEIRTQRAEVDKISFKKLIASHNKPSVELATIYRLALTEPSVGPLHFHARTPADNQEAKRLPALQLGDVFVKDPAAPVYMVINAACDLAMAPDTDRGYNPAQPIFLVSGILQPISQPIGNSEAIRTELFELAKAVYRIVWRHKDVRTLRFDEVWDWLNRAGYRLEARLRLPYALEVQQAFATSLTRIGMPVQPPICSHGDVEPYCQAIDGAYLPLGTKILDGAIIVRVKVDRKYEDHFVLTMHCVDQLRGRLNSLRTAFEARLAAEKAGTHFPNKKKGFDDEDALLCRFTDHCENWLTMSEDTRKLPDPNNTVVVAQGFLEAFWNGDMKGKYPSRKPSIVLNVRRDEITNAPSETQPETAGDATVPGKGRSPEGDHDNV
jgi:hypothetical protein